MPEQRGPGENVGQLLEVLRRTGREEAGRVGFGVARSAPVKHAALALAAVLPAANLALVAASQTAGADAVFLPLSRAATIDAPSSSEGKPALICGIAQTEELTTPADLDRWQNAGIDSVALRPRAALAACFSPRRQGLLALLERNLPMDSLRAAATLRVDAFVLEDARQQPRLSGDDLLWLTLVAGIVRGPALLMSSRVTAEDLEALVGLGLAGVAVTFPPDTSPERLGATLATLREAVNELDPHLARAGRERSGGPVIIPFSGSAAQE